MRIYLRSIKKDDAHLIIKWHNSFNVLNHCFNKDIITEESQQKFYDENIMTGKYMQFIVERIEEISGVASYPIATVYLKNIDSNNKRCELCIFTSDDEEWNTESQRIAIKQLLEKAFKELNMHKVYSYVFSKNTDEVELFKSSGFVQEACLKDESIDVNGNYCDAIRFCIFNREEHEKI